MSDPKNEKILTTRGVVTESLPSTLFRVKIPASTDSGEDDKEILAYL